MKVGDIGPRELKNLSMDNGDFLGSKRKRKEKQSNLDSFMKIKPWHLDHDTRMRLEQMIPCLYPHQLQALVQIVKSDPTSKSKTDGGFFEF
jgi:hypothetical protein